MTTNATKHTPHTDAVVEGVPMHGTMAEYRTRQVAALEVFAGEQERTIKRLVAALRSGIASLEQFVKLGRITENNKGLRDMRAALELLEG